MNTFTYENIRIAGIATAVPDARQDLTKVKSLPAQELERFCSTTGIYSRYYGSKYHQTTADLCFAAADRLLTEKNIPRDEVGAMVLLTQTPDYLIPPTSCVLQHRLGLTNCGLVYDSNLGCSSLPFGLQMMCAAMSPTMKYAMVLIGESTSYSKMRKKALSKDAEKDALLFGDAGCAVLLERCEGAAPIRIGLHTIGSGYRDLIAPFGMQRHPLRELIDEVGDDALAYNNVAFMDGENVFSFSITTVPKIMKRFMAEIGISADDMDFLAIHQANKLIVDNVLKRLKVPAEKVCYSMKEYGNTRGVSCVLSVCQQYGGSVERDLKHVDFLAFGIGLNIGMADVMLDPSVCLPIFTTRESYDDGIHIESYMSKSEE